MKKKQRVELSLGTIQALREALLALSASGNAHYKEVAEQIEDTRATLLVVEGFDINSVSEYRAKLQEIKALDKDIEKLQQQRENLQLVIEGRKTYLRQTEADVSDAIKQLEELREQIAHHVYETIASAAADEVEVPWDGETAIAPLLPWEGNTDLYQHQPKADPC